MKQCSKCGKQSNETARFCEDCGNKFAAEVLDIHATREPVSRPVSNPSFRATSVTSVGIPPIVESNGAKEEVIESVAPVLQSGVHSMLIIERGGGQSTEFPLSNEESQIGRWDADNGIFPDVDLDAFDADAKVSRRHARVISRNGSFMVEDLGSTNGTFVNRGRRLLPGSPQALTDGDEIIVGKTFLRFKIKQD
ncbi:MAG: FHA domain-containing protein [Pyrinomonadaceae bacterium]